MSQDMGFVLRESGTGATVSSSIETVEQVKERAREQEHRHDVVVERLKERLEQLIREIEKKYRELGIGWLRELIEKRLEEAKRCLEGRCNRGRVSSLLAELSMLSRSIDTLAARLRGDEKLREVLEKVDEPHLQRFVLRMIMAGNIDAAVDAVKRRLSAKRAMFSGEHLYRMAQQLVERIMGVRDIDELYEKLDKMGESIAARYKPLIQRLVERVKEGDLGAFRQLVAVLHNIRRISMARTARNYAPAEAVRKSAGSKSGGEEPEHGQQGRGITVKQAGPDWWIVYDASSNKPLFALKGKPVKLADGVYMVERGQSALFRSRLDGALIYVKGDEAAFVLADYDYDKTLKTFRVPTTNIVEFVAERATNGVEQANIGLVKLPGITLVLDADAIDYEKLPSMLDNYKLVKIGFGGYLRLPLVRQTYLLSDVLDIKVGGVTYRVPLHIPFSAWGCDKPDACKYPPLIAVSVTPRGYRMTIYVPRNPSSLADGLAKVVLEYGGGYPRKYRVVHIDDAVEKVVSLVSGKELKPGATVEANATYTKLYYIMKPVYTGAMRPRAAIGKLTVVFFLHGGAGAKQATG